jgi:hypothetical protein
MEYRYNLAFHADSLELAGELNVHYPTGEYSRL